jgi:hypothetical protein
MARDYDEHSEYQRAVADTATSLLTESVGAVPVAPRDAFVVADYGASTGRTRWRACATRWWRCATGRPHVPSSRPTTTSRRTTGTSSSPT